VNGGPRMPIAPARTRGAFVGRLGPGTEFARGQFDGSVEEVDTGKRLNFRSTEELLRFLGQSFDESLRRERESNRGEEQQEDE
jgi:hypothetical protein